MPLISVIIPVYNGEKTIRETIKSALQQTFSDFELIIINDGSQDATLAIVNSIKDPRIKVFSYPNTGSNPSRNRGVSHATGEYIAFLDADDLWTPNKLESQLIALQANPQAAVAYSWTNSIDELGQFLRQGSHISVTGDVYKQLLLSNFLDSGSNPLIRAHALAAVGGFDESLAHGEDLDMWLRLADHYQFVAVPSPQILYRQSSNSVSSNIKSMEASTLRVLEQAFERKPEFKHLKRKSFGNLYKYLTYKALEQPPKRRLESLTAARFFGLVVINDIALIREQFIWQVLLKIILWLFLQPQQAQKLINTKFNTLYNIQSTLLMHFKMEHS